MADEAGPNDNGDSPRLRSGSHSRADHGFDDHRENGSRARRREVLPGLLSCCSLNGSEPLLVWFFFWERGGGL